MAAHGRLTVWVSNRPVRSCVGLRSRRREMTLQAAEWMFNRRHHPISFYAQNGKWDPGTPSTRTLPSTHGFTGELRNAGPKWLRSSSGE